MSVTRSLFYPVRKGSINRKPVGERRDELESIIVDMDRPFFFKMVVRLNGHTHCIPLDPFEGTGSLLSELVTELTTLG